MTNPRITEIVEFLRRVSNQEIKDRELTRAYLFEDAADILESLEYVGTLGLTSMGEVVLEKSTCFHWNK